MPGEFLNLPYVALVMAAFLAGSLSLSLVYFFKGVGDVINDFERMVRRRRFARTEGMYLKARVKAGQGKLDKALHLVDKALARNADHYDGMMLKGDILRRMGRAKDALRAHSLALSLRPADMDAILQIKNDYRASGNLDAAYRVLEQVRSRLPHDLEALSEMRDISVMEGEFHRAAAFQREILSQVESPVDRKAEQVKMAEICCLYGEQLMAEGKPDLARENFHMALKMEPDFVSAAMLLCDVLLGLSMREEAGDILKKIFNDSGSPTPLLKLAEMDPDGAEAAYIRGAQHAPALQFLHPLLMLEKLKKRDFAASSAMLERIPPEYSGLPVFDTAKKILELHSSGGSDAVAMEPLVKTLKEGMENMVHYKCDACGAVEGKYFPQCPSCGNWNSASVFFGGTRPAGTDTAPAGE